MFASEFEQILQSAAEARDEASVGQHIHRDPALRLGIGGWPAPGTDRTRAAPGGTPDGYLKQYLEGERGEAADVPSITIDDLKQKIRAGLTDKQVAALRRQFANQSHPDRVDPCHRQAATDLMAEANDLLDQAARQSR